MKIWLELIGYSKSLSTHFIWYGYVGSPTYFDEGLYIVNRFNEDYLWLNLKLTYYGKTERLNPYLDHPLASVCTFHGLKQGHNMAYFYNQDCCLFNGQVGNDKVELGGTVRVRPAYMSRIFFYGGVIYRVP